MLGEKNQRTNHGLSSEGCNEICTCCHSLITPDLPGSFNLNQTGLLPTLADSGIFFTYQHKVKTMCKHTCVCMGVCVCLLLTHWEGGPGKGRDFLLWGTGRVRTANLLANAAAATAAKSLQLCLTLVRPQRRQPTSLLRPWDSPGKNTGVGCHFLLRCMKVKSES